MSMGEAMMTGRGRGREGGRAGGRERGAGEGCGRGVRERVGSGSERRRGERKKGGISVRKRLISVGMDTAMMTRRIQSGGNAGGRWGEQMGRT